MALTGICPVCGGVFERATTGRLRIYCCDNHRLIAFRRSHGLGWKMLREAGIEDDRSLLSMLADVLENPGIADR